MKNLNRYNAELNLLAWTAVLVVAVLYFAR
jgi:hypothetical protein